MIQEKLQERKQRKERELEQQREEQSRMVEEQEKAIKQVLNTQAGLAEEYASTKKICFFLPGKVEHWERIKNKRINGVTS